MEFAIFLAKILEHECNRKASTNNCGGLLFLSQNVVLFLAIVLIVETNLHFHTIF